MCPKDFQGEFEVLYFTQSSILSHLSRHPKAIGDNNFMDVLIGWLLAQFLADKQRELMMIGVPSREGWEKYAPRGILRLEDLLSNYNRIVAQTEIDVLIGNKDMYRAFQVTRFTNPTGKPPQRNLAELISKKCGMYDDNPQLNLVVNLEMTPAITESELKDVVGRGNVPFGSVFVIGKSPTVKGRFGVVQLHPVPVIGKEVDLPLSV